MVLVHPGDAILPELGPELGEYAQRSWQSEASISGSDTKVMDAGEGWVTLSDGSPIGDKNAGLDRRHLAQSASRRPGVP